MGGKRLNIWLCMLVIFLCPVLSPLLAAPNLYKEAGIGSFEYTQEFIIKNTGQGEARAIRGEIPVMAWTGLPSYQKIKSVIANPPVVWNKNGYSISFTLDSLPPQHSYRMNIKYKIELSECFQDPPNQPAYLGYGGKSMAGYLKVENGIETDAPQIVAVLNRLGIQSETPKEKARKIFAFVSDTLDYRVDFARDASALKALQTGWGRCEDYAMLFVALCRAAGVPARMAYGFRFVPDELRGNQASLNDAGHAWAEAFLPSVGWISVDPTYVALYKGKKVTDYRYFAGFYPDDIHIFTSYGEPTSTVYYDRNRDDVKLEYETNSYISRTDNGR